MFFSIKFSLTFAFAIFLLSATIIADTFKGYEPPTNLKAFPGENPCEIEIVFQRNDLMYDYYIFGLFGSNNQQVLLHAKQEYRTLQLPITVVNGSGHTIGGAFADKGSFSSIVPIVVKKCSKEGSTYGEFQNKILIKGFQPGIGANSTRVYQSSIVKVKGSNFPVESVFYTVINTNNASQEIGIHGELPPVNVELKWVLDEGLKEDQITGYWVNFGPFDDSTPPYVDSFYIEGAKNTQFNYTMKIVPKSDTKRSIYVAICVQTIEGSITDPTLCRESNLDYLRPERYTAQPGVLCESGSMC